MKELSTTLRSLLRVWLYAPIAFIGSVLIALMIRVDDGNGLVYGLAFGLFVTTLFVMSKIKELEERHEPAELLKKMMTLAGGLLLPLAIKDIVHLLEGKRIDFVSNLGFEVGGPILLAAVVVLFPGGGKGELAELGQRFRRYLVRLGLARPERDDNALRTSF